MSVSHLCEKGETQAGLSLRQTMHLETGLEIPFSATQQVTGSSGTEKHGGPRTGKLIQLFLRCNGSTN